MYVEKNIIIIFVYYFNKSSINLQKNKCSIKIFKK